MTTPHRTRHPQRGFTLVEILVVIVIVATLAAFSFSFVKSARIRADQAVCVSNLRNIGTALQIYAQDHNGVFPETTHTSAMGQTWIYALEQEIGNFNEVRICPADPKRQERLEQRGSSYILNSYIFVPELDPFGEPMGAPLNRISAIPDPARTLLAFVCADTVGVGAGNDHTHSERWSSWGALCADIAPGRHGGSAGNDPRGSSNYLFADGHVESWKAADVKRRVDAGENIALPPGIER
jgi:prepilin-type N-terminal cleavage/methylation domain-containing protein/prepilin-type processing-associated H-X9-DG protein